MTENLFGKSIGKLGFGFMRLPSLDQGFDMEQINKMVDLFMESGFTYFDTAYVYRGSERALCQSLVERYPRDSFQIATKLNLGGITSPEQLVECSDKSFARLGVDYVDVYLLHGLGNRTGNRDDELGAWDYIAGLKAAGKAKHIGCSFHGTPEKLDEILTKHPEAEVVQLQVNYLDWESKDVQSRLLCETVLRHKKALVIMEPVKGGMLAGEESVFAKVFKAADPSLSVASWAVRFAASLDGVMTVLSGMSTLAQMEDNLATMKDFKPLSESDRKVIDDAVAALKGVPRVPCTECGYCLEGCPQKIKIPALMNIYSSYLAYKTKPGLARQYMFSESPPAKSCEKCKKCEETCPQGIGIIEVLEKVSELFD
jgi:predicted aldo/keto reductase-like oxidoreductase